MLKLIQLYSYFCQYHNQKQNVIKKINIPTIFIENEKGKKIQVIVS